MVARSLRVAPLNAFVLHRYDWSESSLILDVFTREQGRLAVAAKGAKRPYSQLRSVLLPFQRIHVSLGRLAAGEGAGDVQTLRSAEWAGGAAMLTGAALFSGFYLNELLMKLLARQDPHALLFDAYAQTLPALAVGDDAQVEAALRAFELTLLKEVGVLPDLSQVTLTQQPLQPTQRYALLPEAGVATPRTGDADLTGDALTHLQAALEHGSLPALQHACTPVLQALKPQLRALLHYHLGGAPLRTRQVMLDLQGLERVAPTP
ncbi:MAG: DNA recombination protein RecO [Methylibium sp. NZG]|nr:MAG: DNA recombination protein RecO [Methylibium sp. NZG]